MSDQVQDHTVEEYDVLIEGTSLMHSILATALSLDGSKVVHIDEHDYYGAINACIPHPYDGHALPASVRDYNMIPGSAQTSLGPAREYNIELLPRLLYTSSPMIKILQNLGIGEYVQFKSLNSFYLYKDGELERAPSSKEDIFTSTTMPLIVKRRLMKFIKFCAETSPDQLEYDKKESLVKIMKEQFRLESDMIEAVSFALAGASNAQASLGDTLPNIQAHLKSLGLFGPFPVVIPMYGSGSELTQAFCRKAAVKGCTYILGQKMDSPTTPDNIFRLSSGHQLSAKHVVKPRNPTECSHTTRRIYIVVGEFQQLMNGGDGAVIAFAPEKAEDQVIHCQVYGKGAGVCPDGQSVIHLSGGDITPGQFDAACQKLRAKCPFEIIVTLEYKLQDPSVAQSYDDLINEAQSLFLSLTHGTGDFLPQQPQEGLDRSDDY
ncbi:Uncharacterized Rab geranylgeranyltransferase C15C4.03 [Taphrina deformans PYCC 5710]|uniref:Uncharacterized Rab geranylgeranyltransferase C15C4.03 n=1 Tax=Taphrina deformans (strain PYCC 5710 / ATCC 11124 / CBS 356.35 / IMI 108563 / JCM 9778 / NBRC 8474) TaxID=1097556 RepID=R4XJ88_TAPDE|nr:Uncharacterized Rab geranylgeranyltransferase C15C4.03 [Taphrina deformans PYCC 5710]|eukprot:CCG83430.1 Uncharacterized Rab geranylgeranyltransferase C15C4.03 [Taphrina deformans PYCC 5710]